MLKNYFISALRHAARHKKLSALTIFCLSIGMTFSLLIGIYVIGEKSVNATLGHLDNQYVIHSKWKQENMGMSTTTLGPLAKTIKEDYPGLVANYYRFDPATNIVSVNEKHFRTDISIGDTSLISMYGFPLLYGNKYHAFRNNESAVVTESFAMKFFGQKDVVDKIISIQTPADGRKHNFQITAVLKDLPRNNSVTNFAGHYQVFLPMENNQFFQGGDKGDNWSNVFIVGMIELKDGVRPQDLDKPFEQVLAKYQPDFVKGNLQVQLESMRDYYLKNNGGSVAKMINALSLIAAFILIITVVNFVNINIGISSYRLKEIGMRKVFGGRRLQLVGQYLMESVILAVIAALFSIVLFEFLRPIFNGLLNAAIEPPWKFNLPEFALLLSLVLAVGLVAGIYPAFVLSSINIVNAAKGKLDSGRGGLIVGKILLVVQFCLAIVVIICTINISNQVSYFFNKDLGFDKDQVMIISSLPRQWDSAGVIEMENVKSQFLTIPNVKSASLSHDIPDGNPGGNINVYPQNNNDFVSMILLAADVDLSRVYDIRLKEGVLPDEDHHGNVQGRILINEAAEKAMGWNGAAGKTVRIGASNGPLLTITGVVKDFHYESLQKNVQPLVIMDLNEPYTRSYRYISLKLNSSGLDNTIAALQQKCKLLFPDAGFEYFFLNDKFQTLYESELQLKKASKIATVLNLIVVLLGIFGVLSFTLAKRTKEIAVRKVLGAEILNIVTLFIKDYSLLIFLASAIACPLAYFFSERWLQTYAYRIEQNVFPFIAGICFMFSMASLLIALQCLNAARANPVVSLRTE